MVLAGVDEQGFRRVEKCIPIFKRLAQFGKVFHNCC